MNGFLVNKINSVNNNGIISQECSEGAPYNLSTPRISCAESPLERDVSEVTLPSLNNKRTLELVDRKREKHRAYMSQDASDEEIGDVINVADDNAIHANIWGSSPGRRSHNNDDDDEDHVHSTTFTPENSSDENGDDDDEFLIQIDDTDDRFDSDHSVSRKSKENYPTSAGGLSSKSDRDSIGLLPSMNNASTIEKIRSKREKWKQNFDDEFNSEESSTNDASSESSPTKTRSKTRSQDIKQDISGNENTFTPTNSVSDDGLSPSKFEFNSSPNSQWEDGIDTLADKVNEKRMKLETENYELTASTLVKEVIETSIDLVLKDEQSIALLTDQWSPSYTDDEKQIIRESVQSGDLETIGELITTAMLRDISSTESVKSTNRDDLNVTVALETDYNQSPISMVANNQSNSMIVAAAAAVSTTTPGSYSVEDASWSLYRRLSSSLSNPSCKEEASGLKDKGGAIKEEERILLNAAGEKNLDQYTAATCEHENRTDINDEDIITKKLDPNMADEEIEKKWDFSKMVINCGVCTVPDENSDVQSSKTNTDDSSQPYNESSDNMKTKSCQVIALYNCYLPTKPFFTSRSSSNSGTPSKKKESSTSNDDELEKVEEATECAAMVDGDYTEMMEALIRYLESHIEKIETDEYILVYFHCHGNGRKTPPLSWIQQCYKTINYKLQKKMIKLYIVHPTIWLKGLILFASLFIDSSFSPKIQYVPELENLKEFVPDANIEIPDVIVNLESRS